MNKLYYVFILIACFYNIPIFGYWDKSCLAECFATGHECNYCSYQCQKEALPVVYSKEENICPLYDFQKHY